MELSPNVINIKYAIRDVVILAKKVEKQGKNANRTSSKLPTVHSHPFSIFVQDVIGDTLLPLQFPLD